MGLPHYNLNANEESQEMPQSAFPVILVPAEPQQKRGWGRKIIRSKILLTTFGILAALAGGVALWLVLDPNNGTMNRKDLLIPAIVLGVCVIYFALAAWVGKEKEGVVSRSTDDQPNEEVVLRVPAAQIASLDMVKELPAPTPHTHVEVFFEQWSSEPYNEIIDDAVLAEVFNDDLLAPDHMVFSLKVDD